MVAELLRGYVREPWVDELDFASLEKVNAGYVSDDLRQREDDVVWRVRLGPRWIYLYLLLEFQSTVEPFMAVRLLTYIGLLYQDLIRQGLATERLPPVLPIVIYNGERRWTAATELADLIEPMPAALRRYQANLHYWLLDEGRLPESALPAENPVTALLLLERSQAPAEMLRALDLVLRWLDAGEQRSLRRAFAIWVQRALLRNRLAGQTFPELDELSEVRDMLAERVKEWTEQWKREGLEQGWKEGLEKGLQEGLEKGMGQGLEKGLAEGRTAGRREGEAAVLLRQLARKFGPLPDRVADRVREADAETLLVWSERILTASRCEEVFGDEAP
jgi:predicted transposase/invertase (TIGR01784 family)